MKTFKRSAAKQDISFYLNFDIFITILGFECDSALYFQALYCSSNILVGIFNVNVHENS